MLAYLALLAGCLLLYKGGDWLLEGVIDFGNHLQWPKAITGLLLVSLGTSAPELFVSLGAAVQGQGAIAAGNVLGSNIINIAIVLGMAATVGSLHVERLLQNQLVALMIISAAAALILLNGQVTRLEGSLLLGILCISFAYAFRSNIAQSTVSSSINEATVLENSIRKSTLLTLGGIMVLVVGAEAMIWGGVALADQLGIEKSVVALTVTALGTSLPEIAATIVAISRREPALAIGNVIGSNLMNIGQVLGLSALIAPLGNVNIDLLSMAFFLTLTFLVFIKCYWLNRISRWFGVLLLLSYGGYVVLIVN